MDYYNSSWDKLNSLRDNSANRNSVNRAQNPAQKRTQWRDQGQKPRSYGSHRVKYNHRRYDQNRRYWELWNGGDFEELMRFMERDMKLRNYSVRTIKAYLGCVRRYVDSRGGDLAFDLDQIQSFLEKELDRGSGGQTVNLYLNALKFFLS